QEMSHPRHRVRGGVFASEQHGQDVAINILIAESSVPFVARAKHRFEQIRGVRGEVRIRGQTFAPASNEAVDGLANRGERFLESAIFRKLEIAPVWKRRVDAPVDHWK